MVSFNFWPNSNPGNFTIGSSPQDTQQEDQSPHPDVPSHSTSQVALATPRADVEHLPSSPARRSFNFFQSRADHDHHKPIVTTEQERKKERQAVHDLKHAVLSQTSSSKSDKRAKESADIVRSLIIGHNSITPASKKTKPLTKAQLNKVKSDLGKPKSANKVIARLRQLDFDSNTSSLPVAQSRATRPIHAVCLDVPDEEAGQRHFARLKVNPNPMLDEGTEVYPSVVTASIDSVTSLFSDLSVVNMLSPDLGLGESIGGPGILSGAVPMAETVLNGIEMMTPQILSLGYATGKAIVPDHKGIHPPIDRISALTYWWGFEIVLPPPTLQYLDNAQSISHSVLNFLTVLAAVNNGVREILPFVRYISQYIEFEFNTIKAQNKGNGVVCAATWIMPVALVPRPWDFDSPVDPTGPANEDPSASEPDSTQPSDGSKPPNLRVEDDSPFVDRPSAPSRSDCKPGLGVSSDIKVTLPPEVTVV